MVLTDPRARFIRRKKSSFETPAAKYSLSSPFLHDNGQYNIWVMAQQVNAVNTLFAFG